MVKDKFGLTDEETLDLEDTPGTMQIIEFEGPLGKMQLTWTTRPRVIDKKTHGSHRIGSQATVEYIYSDTEKVHEFKAYRWDEALDDWAALEISADAFQL